MSAPLSTTEFRTDWRRSFVWGAKTMRMDAAHSLLNHGMRHHEKILKRNLVVETLAGFGDWSADRERDLHRSERQVPRAHRKAWRASQPFAEIENDRRRTASELATFLKRRATALLQALAQTDIIASEFRKGLAVTIDDDARRTLILQSAASLGATPAEVAADEKALGRWMDDEAIFDRIALQRGAFQQQLAFTFDRLGVALSQCSSESGGDPDTASRRLWSKFGLDQLATNTIRYPCDPRVHTAVTKCLRHSLTIVAPAARVHLLGDQLLGVLFRAASDPTQDVWLQCEAVHTLAALGIGDWRTVAHRRLLQAASGDDMFVRRFTIRLLVDDANSTGNHCALEPILNQLESDASEFVRQQLAHSLWQLPPEIGSRRLLRILTTDEAPKVRAAAIVAGISSAKQPAWHDFWIEFTGSALCKDQPEFVIRTALFAANSWLANCDDVFHDECSAKYLARIDPAIRELRSQTESVPVRRWCDNALEQLWLLTHGPARALAGKLRPIIDKTRPGHSRTLPRKLLVDPSGRRSSAHSALLGRVLAVLAQEDFGLEIEETIFGPRLVRGKILGTRLWRVLHEIRTSATDKRQGFRHTIGRISHSKLRAPSGILAEMSLTKVPGEPLFIAEDETWRPYIPLLDDFISAATLIQLRDRPVQFFTAAGVTEVKPPGRIWQRLKALAYLNWNFKQVAELRNWTNQSGHQPNGYVKALRKLGFEVTFRPHTNETCSGRDSVNDDSVGRFFASLPILAPSERLAPMWDLILDYADYFSATLDSTFTQMLLFVVAAFTVFVLRHSFVNRRLSTSRDKVAISLGGWGTRGKSGTERLKAALISALGHSMISKTTGCEAMFIQGDPFGEQLEIPLYRPGDKATIWEHYNVIRMAGQMNSSVFLWECMALSPTYVDVLQRQWSRDDLSTITNAYPDHEDIQGPAGYNVAQSISGFVPLNARVVTTEGQMRPILRESCRSARTSLRTVGWLESGLITDDVQERFPYLEHPDNIALVAAMADELGVPYDFALKGMADGLVPDLGVLKVYPIAEIDTRKVEFINGMSANERFGCLGNWKRMGFADHNPYQDPGVWLTTVVNNRADRVARSKVFASILVNDVTVDRHYFIGTNLDGMRGYIIEALDARLGGMSFPDETAAARERLMELALQHRMIASPDQAQARLKIMVAALHSNHSPLSDIDVAGVLEVSTDADALAARLTELGVDEALVRDLKVQQQWALQTIEQIRQMDEQIRQRWSSARAEVEAGWKAMLREWFLDKLDIVDDPKATGEQIIYRIVKSTPPGVRNRVMGVQNIKGTGMDFIYRFQYWDQCFRACRMLESRDSLVIQKGLDTLQNVAMGQLCLREVERSIEHARNLPNLQSTDFQSAMDSIMTRVAASQSSMAQMKDAFDRGVDRRKSSWKDTVITKVEQFLDVNDEARRRNQADRIYRDLERLRIGKQHAVSELRRISRRQKGGWLREALNKRYERRRKPVSSNNEKE